MRALTALALAIALLFTVIPYLIAGALCLLAHLTNNAP